MDRALVRGAIAAAALACLPAAAAPGDALWYLQVDNDVAFSTDRWYTSGVRIARVKDGVEWGLLQEIYTPEASRWHRGVSDRAPVGRLLLSLARHDISGEAFQTIELMAGVRGPSAGGRPSTESIHRVIPAPQVDWRRQLGDAFDATFAAARTQRFGPVKIHAGAQLGTQLIFAHAGFEARFGSAAHAASRLLRFAATPELSLESGWSAYAGAGLRGVFRNELLSRNYDPEGPALSRERAVTRIAAGVTWTGTWGAVTFDLAQDSREFAQQREPHRFGSLALHVSF
ncbi:MAG TPA: lipid A-modifier LpxR family protein [Usitatibacter sp.]|nr:lipid A-modifier LpxR family protein [Usitatibacter sp.]